jgi:hypothetical protein
MPATEQDDILLTYFQRLPKVELHLHLEGAIPLPSLWRLIEKYGGERRQHERPPRPRAPAPAPRPQAITPPAPHADPPLEPQAQRTSASGRAHRARPAVSGTLGAQTTAVKRQVDRGKWTAGSHVPGSHVP